MAGADGARISVVVATHNGERFIEAQLESLLAQSRPPCEIVVSDDASADRTLSICREVLGRSDIPFSIICNRPPLGFRDNFLRAALKTKGDYVAFCDQDDIWSPAKLARCAEVLAADDHVVLVSHTAALIDDADKPIGLLRQGIRSTMVKPPLSYDPWHTFLGFSMVFRKSLLEAASVHDRFDDYIVDGEQIAHDRWVMFLAHMLGSTAEIDEPLVAYRQHSNNLFGAFSKAARRRQTELTRRSVRYITATSQMIRIARDIPEAATDRFPQFDRARCVAFLEAALAQLQARDRVYQASSHLEAVHRLWACLTTGHYRSLNDGRMRWKSLGRDLFAVVA